jgi:hypothetical protein
MSGVIRLIRRKIGKPFSLAVMAIIVLSLIVPLSSIPKVLATTSINSGWEQSEGTDNTDNGTWITDAYSVVNSTTKKTGTGRNYLV